MQSFSVLVGLTAIFSVAYGEQCEDGQFQCSNGTCIPDAWFCDGINDCGDLTDEPLYCQCFPGWWKCPNSWCIHPSWVCDGDNDCGDWSDEKCGLCESHQNNITQQTGSMNKVDKVKTTSLKNKHAAYDEESSAKREASMKTNSNKKFLPANAENIKNQKRE